MADSWLQVYQDDAALISSDQSFNDVHPIEIHAGLLWMEKRENAPSIKIIKIVFHTRFFGIIQENS